jgi:3-deoxy-D-manno-octulosonic-acid transferase
VAGSTWPEDENIIASLFKEYPEWKFIIAPHEIKDEKINRLSSLTESSIKYSEFKLLETLPFSKQVLIIDNIGMLSALYQYADISYIGGGFGVGIHNTLEAAAFGVPVIFGLNYTKFREAKALIELKSGFSVKDETELMKIMNKLQDSELRKSAGDAAKQYVNCEKGATATIMGYVTRLLK